jgi:hypothetical protein
MGKIKNLLIPRKNQDPVKQPDYSRDMRAIEVWAQQLTDVGFYASLTGPGETVTPGRLTQQGDFEVNGSGTFLGLVGNTASMSANNQLGIEGHNLLHLDSSGTVTGYGGSIDLASTANEMTITMPQFGLFRSGGASSGTGNILFELLNGTSIGFYGASPQIQTTVTGSRGGNVALQNLLTTLANMGLIVDGTSP